MMHSTGTFRARTSRNSTREPAVYSHRLHLPSMTAMIAVTAVSLSEMKTMSHLDQLLMHCYLPQVSVVIVLEPITLRQVSPLLICQGSQGPQGVFTGALTSY